MLHNYNKRSVWSLVFFPETPTKKEVRKLLGIPTQSEAAMLSEDYADAVDRAALQDKLQCFRDVFSTIFPNNHVVQAYHDAGKFKRFPNSLDIQAIVPWRVPRKVRGMLDPLAVNAHYLQAAENFRRNMVEARTYLSPSTDLTIYDDENEPYTTGPLLTVKFQAIVGPVKGMRYTFPVYDLVGEILSDFTRTITELYHDRVSAIERIINMMSHADYIANSLNVVLASRALVIDGASSKHRFEANPVHIAGQLNMRNHEVADASDVWLSFSERTFHARIPDGLRGIPAGGILDDDNRMRYDRLSNRRNLRETINGIVAEKGSVIINGTDYELQSLVVDGKSVIGYFAWGKSYQEIANLLGKPVLQQTHEVIVPEQWAAEEAELVNDFLQKGSSTALEVMLDRYDLDSSAGHPSRKRAMEQLRYSLGTK